jgi:hypothetical protein
MYHNSGELLENNLQQHQDLPQAEDPDAALAQGL